MMNNYHIHTVDSAPQTSKATLEKVQNNYGRIPNLLAVLAEAPATLNAYLQLHQLFTNTSFNTEELTVIWQTINIEHDCTYCVPAHTAMAHAMSIDQTLIDALRYKQPLPTEKLQVLHDTTMNMVRNRGHLCENEITTFYQSGYTKQHVLEIVLGISQKVISNYAAHLTNVPVDSVNQQFT
jgi:alkylhydroperoxidase family enzyme